MRALIVKTSALGDIVQSYPVVEYLKTRQSVDRIGWVVEKKFSSLVKAHPLVDDVIEIDSAFLRSFSSPLKCIEEFVAQRGLLRKDSWDVLFDLQANCKSGLYTLLSRATKKVGYGRNTVAEWPNILATNHRKNPPQTLSAREEYIWMAKSYFHDESVFEPSHVSLRLTKEEEQLVAQELARWPSKKSVWMLAIGSRWPNKMCSTESFKELLLLVREKYSPYFVFTAGNGEELKEIGALAAEFCKESHVIFRPELPVLQHVMSHADLVLSVDSLLLHLAATTGTPTFGFFGPSLGKKYAPSGIGNGYFQGSCPFDVLFEKRCPFLRSCQKGSCLKDSSPAIMFKALSSWLS